ncbi:MAG TPA: helix-turn-helix domain-containing protein [Acidimicrobiales bacterium]|nr:helix-turn-helix domain-containing protein [Acidimicrobiales bacterium]
MGQGPPALYTVEEAARLMRVGRTKAYAMTREWRATGGASGLPVVDFGNVLRVPRHALEQILGVELGEVSLGDGHGAADGQTETAAVEPEPTVPAQAMPQRASRHRRNRTYPANQLDLFGPTTT